MAKIKIADLESVEAKTVIKTLNYIESQSIVGGEYLDGTQALKLGLKVLGFFGAIYAIDAITYLATFSSFKDGK